LLEETGYEAAEWTRIGVIHTAIAYTDEAIELFLARKLRHVARKLDDGEFLELLIVPFDRALEMIREGRITDSKSVSGLLWVDKWLRR
jgi:ADP-ribose diphosphatase